MEKIKTYLIIFLVLTLGFIPFVPTFEVIDLIAPQYLYLSLTQILITVYLIVNKRDKEVSFTLIDISYILFLFFGLISFFKSYNLTESVIEWAQFLTLFITYFNLKILFDSLENRKQIFLFIFLSLVLIESLVVLKVFLQNYSLDNGLLRIKELGGLSSNQNVGAFSLLIKVPIILFLYQKAKKIKVKFFLGLLFSIIAFDILIISSRAAIIGLIFTVATVFIYEILKTKDSDFKFKLSVIFSPLLVLIFFLQSYLYQENKDLIGSNRITSYNDTSVNDRIDFFNAAIDLFIQNPFTGIGIGNYKILSLNEVKDGIINYTAPYHTHNDLLQMASEIGLFGFLSFFIIIFSPIFFLLKEFLNKRDLNEITPFLLLAFIIYFWDSNINFPRIRPYSQMNFIFILSFFCSDFKQLKKYKIIKVRSIMFIFLALLLPLNFIHSKVFKSYENMTYLYYDFNENGLNLQANLEVVKEYQDTFPNITNTTIPLKLAKANYFLQNKDYQTAKDLIIQGRRHNSFLGFGDLLMAKIFYETGVKDSALYYIENAYKKIPKNGAHVALYQTLLSEINDKTKENEVFEKTKILKEKVIWENHFYLVITDSIKLSENSFSQKDKENINEAILLFPDSPIVNAAFLVVTQGKSASYLATEYDLLATEFYAQKKYRLAIDNWDKAYEIVNAEDSYILNIAMSYCQLKEYNLALETLKLIEKNKIIKSKDGLFEFIAGYSFSGLNKLTLACKYLRQSKKMGYIPASKLLETINCQSN
tara:strand:- start:1881 stop:4163 length:2283 start_codon:yes stop_codon:yes gene_type:complete